MKKIRIREYYNDYEIEEQMEHDLKLMMRQLKLTNPFKKYDTKTYYDEKDKQYKCDIYDVTKVRVFEIIHYNGKRYSVEINGNDKTLVYYFVVQNMKNRLENLDQIYAIKNVKTGKTMEIPKVDIEEKK